MFLPFGTCSACLIWRILCAYCLTAHLGSLSDTMHSGVDVDAGPHACCMQTASKHVVLMLLKYARLGLGLEQG